MTNIQDYPPPPPLPENAAASARLPYAISLNQPALLSTSIPSVGISDLVSAFLSGKSPTTILAYHKDLVAFAQFLNSGSVDASIRTLIESGPGPANLLVLNFKASMIEGKLAPATVNRRLSALRSVISLAGVLGIVAWELRVPGMKSQIMRDTRGPGLVGMTQLFAAAKAQHPVKAARDLAVLRLLCDLALRRGEVVSLELSDLDLDGSRLRVMEKDHFEKSYLSLPPITKQALEHWLVQRGAVEGPLFINFDRAGKGSRLTGGGLARVIKWLWKQTGLRGHIHVHGVRHTAISTALEANSGNLIKTRHYSRHSQIATLLVYEDARHGQGLEIATQLSTMLG